jgi:hypothetical protein
MKRPIIITSEGKIGNRHDIKFKYNSIISKYLVSSTGRQNLAHSMVAPLRTTRDYQSIGRKTFLVDSLPTGALPVYDKDIEVAALVAPKYKFDALKISSRGEIFEKKNGRPFRARRVIFPTFELFSSPTVKLCNIKRRRFNIIDRNVQKARDQIMNQEDSMIFDVLDKLV